LGPRWPQRFIAEEDADPIQVGTAVDQLEDGELVQVQRAWGDPTSTSVNLTLAGAAEMRAVRTRRADPAARRPAVRRALLSWLYEKTVPGGSTVDLHEFLGDVRSLYLGERVTFAEASQAAQYLWDQDLCVCVDTAETGPLEAAISTDGLVRVEEHDGRASPLPSAGVSTSFDQRVYANGAMNVAAHSQHVTQHAQGVDIEALLAFVRAAAQALPVLGLSESDRQELERLEAEIERLATEPQPDHGRLHAAGLMVRGILQAGAGSALGTGIVAMWPG
jgi:hypothetical protein